MSRASRFLNACRREAVDVTPVWLMRQAGRYMPEYRRLKEKYAFLEMVKTPELATEITLQPVEAFDVDAAIVFQDILPILEPMGLKLEYVGGEGPVIHNPIRTPADVESLAVRPAAEAMDFAMAAIRQVRRTLDGSVPLIGFSGAPFTLVCYAVEGGASRDYRHAKGLMYERPETWRQLMEKMSAAVGDYLQAQAAAGAQALQLFDSWAGALSPGDYEEYVLPHTRCAIEMVADTLRRSGDPFWNRYLRYPAADEAGGRRRDRRGLADRPRRSLEPAGDGRGCAGEPGPNGAVRTRTGDRKAGRPDPRQRPRAAGTHLQPRPRHPAAHAGRARVRAGRFRTRIRIGGRGEEGRVDARLRQS